MNGEGVVATRDSEISEKTIVKAIITSYAESTVSG